MTYVPLITIGASLVAGMLLGSGYFALLYRGLRLHADRATARAILLHLLRLGAAAVAFWGLAQFGALPLLAGLLGFLVVRVVAQRLVMGR